MKFRTTLILAALLALGIFGVVMLQKKDTRKEEAKKSEGKLLDYSGNKIIELFIEPSGIHARRDSSGWKILQPVATDGDKNSLDAITNLFEWAKIERVVSSDGASLADFGLEPPAARLIVVSAAGRDTLMVGEKSQVGSFVYARKNHSSEIFLTTTSLQTNLEKSLFDFRDKSVLAFDRNQANEIEIVNEHGTFMLIRNGAYWEITRPVALRADASKINTLLDRTSYQQASEFVAEEAIHPAQFGLDRPRYQMILTLGANKAQKTLLVGKMDKGKYFGRDQSKRPVFTLDSAYVNLLNVTVASLRNKKLSDFNSGDADRVEIRVGDSLYVCTKDTANEWLLTAPVERRTKSWKVSGILSDLSSLLAENFAADNPGSLAPFGLVKPRVQVKVMSKGQVLQEALFGNEKDKKTVYYKSGSDKVVAVIKKESFDKVNIHLNDIAEAATTAMK